MASQTESRLNVVLKLEELRVSIKSNKTRAISTLGLTNHKVLSKLPFDQLLIPITMHFHVPLVYCPHMEEANLVGIIAVGLRTNV